MTDITTYHLDIDGDNGTPFRFVYWPDEMQATERGAVRYYDRRYTLAEGEQGYGINQMNENGQACGPSLLVSSFTDSGGFGIHGWHDVEAWNVDAGTVALVASWIRTLHDRGIGA